MSLHRAACRPLHASVSCESLCLAVGSEPHTIIPTSWCSLSGCVPRGAAVLPSYGMTECMPISSPPQSYQLDRVGTSGRCAGFNSLAAKPYELCVQRRSCSQTASSMKRACTSLCHSHAYWQAAPSFAHHKSVSPIVALRSQHLAPQHCSDPKLHISKYSVAALKSCP
jgi:hypothetical protein